MKKITILCVNLVFILSTINCSNSKYSDIKEAISKSVQSSDLFIEKFNKADTKNDIKAILTALTEYIDQTKSFQKEMDHFIKKYPELKNTQQPPVELKKDMDQLSESLKRVQNTFLKLRKYAREPEVKKALKKMMDQQSLL